jgi:hypothetical protein
MNLTHFSYSHLPPALAEVGKAFHDIAHGICNSIAHTSTREEALKRLWDAKNWAVMAAIDSGVPGLPLYQDIARQGYERIPDPGESA